MVNCYFYWQFRGLQLSYCVPNSMEHSCCLKLFCRRRSSVCNMQYISLYSRHCSENIEHWTFFFSLRKWDTTKRNHSPTTVDMRRNRERGTNHLYLEQVFLKRTFIPNLKPCKKSTGHSQLSKAYYFQMS